MKLMPMNEKVSVVLVNYNTSDDTNSCIQSLLSSCYGSIEIIVVDNNSKEKEKRILNEYPNTKYYFLEKNTGFAQACNYGVEKSSGRYIFFLNNDTEIEPDAISYLVKEVRKTNVGAVTPQVRFFDDRSKIDRDIGHFDNLAYGWHPRQKKDVDEVETSERILDTPWISGCAFMITREIFESVGKFDEDFFMYCEDLELSIRLIKEGYRLKVVSDALVYHKYSSSSKDGIEIDRSPFQIKQQSKNRMKIIFKHFPLRHISTYLPHLILSNLYWCFVLARNENMRSALYQFIEIVKYSYSGALERRNTESAVDLTNIMETNTLLDYINIALSRSESYNENIF